MKEAVAANLIEVYGRIAEACAQYERDIHDIDLVAVSKLHPARYIRMAVAAGVHNIGESRIQEAEPKIAELGPIARFHLVGHLQTNKVKTAVQIFDVIQSVDSLNLAQEIDRRAAEIGRTIECLVQVNISGEGSKFGVEPEHTLELVRQVNKLPNIDLTGLMTIGPLTEDQDMIRAAFARCRELFRQGQDIVGDDFDQLSMGMSDDFPLAIAEGSTMIRVGTAIFGERPPLN